MDPYHLISVNHHTYRQHHSTHPARSTMQMARLGALIPLAILLLAAVAATAAPSDRPPKAQGPKPHKEKEKEKPKPMKVKCRPRKLYPYCPGKPMECPAECSQSCYADCNSCKPVCGERRAVTVTHGLAGFNWLPCRKLMAMHVIVKY